MPSLEQTNEFVLLRRVLRSIAPEYTLFTHLEMEPGQSRLDVDRRTIVVSDKTEIAIAKVVVLFQIGHVRHPLSISEEQSQDAAKLAQKLSRQDRQAADWAFKTHMAFWPESDPDSVQKTLKSLVSTAFEWLGYIKP